MLSRHAHYWTDKFSQLNYINSHFIKLFRTESPNTVDECRVNFGFPPKYQIFIRNAKFLQKFTASENSVCTLFVSDARQQLYGIFMKFGKISKLHISCATVCDILLLYIAHGFCPSLLQFSFYLSYVLPFMVNKLEYMLPWAHPSTHPKRHLDRLSRFCTAHGIEWLHFTMGRFSP